MFEQIISFLAPHQCVCCGKYGDILCQRCTNSLRTISVEDTLMAYQTLITLLRSDYACIENRVRLNISTYYSGSAKKLIHSLKFGRAKYTAKNVAEIMMPLPVDYDLITYVPTSTSHIRVRGYDHAELIAKNLSKKLQVKKAKLLTKTDQKRQIGSDRNRRLYQLEGSIIAKNPKAITGKRVLLVDDVFTTGSTIALCTRLLLVAGAKSVDVCVFALAESSATGIITPVTKKPSMEGCPSGLRKRS